MIYERHYCRCNGCGKEEEVGRAFGNLGPVGIPNGWTPVRPEGYGELYFGPGPQMQHYCPDCRDKIPIPKGMEPFVEALRKLRMPDPT